MGKLAAQSLVALTRATGETGLGIREWRPLFDVEGAWTEKILVQCSDEAELRRMHTTLQGKQVNIGGFRTSVGVQSHYADLPM